MVVDLVRTGGRQDFTCSKCEEVINKGEPHYRESGGKNSKRYHKACLPDDAKKSPKHEEAIKTNPEPQTSNPETGLARDAKGRFTNENR